MTFELDGEALATLETLANLDQVVLYSVVSEMHNWIYGTDPTHMKFWGVPALVDWFMQTYDFNPTSKMWNLKVTIH